MDPTISAMVELVKAVGPSGAFLVLLLWLVRNPPAITVRLDAEQAKALHELVELGGKVDKLSELVHRLDERTVERVSRPNF